MAAVQRPPQPDYFHNDNSLNTIPDPRSPTPGTPAGGISRSHSSTSLHHPDLSNEVAMLSTKLINAINHQTHLDDTLQATRHELDESKKRVTQLEQELATSKADVITRTDHDAKTAKLVHQLAVERRERMAAEKERKKLKDELEDLSAAVFTQANEMVSTARREAAESLKRNEQLTKQLQDNELLLASHQEQLQDLKAVMAAMSERDEHESHTNLSTAPSSPSPAVHDKMSRMFDSMGASTEDLEPEQPLKYSNLLRPILRDDIQAFEDFTQLLSVVKPGTPQLKQGHLPSIVSPTQQSQNPSATGTPGQNSPSSSSTTWGSTVASTTATSPMSNTAPLTTNGPPLEKSKFYKRALIEDIEPTLRLDTAPGLSFFSRKTVLSSIAQGTLVIEPFGTPSRDYGRTFPCALCGETRHSDAKYQRRHRFKTGEGEAQRYPLCGFCLTKVRSVCDYVGWLRCARDGVVGVGGSAASANAPAASTSTHTRNTTTGESREKAAWEECTRLRERLFWARLGGGVVPAHHSGTDSHRHSVALENVPEQPLNGPATQAAESETGSDDPNGTTPAASSNEQQDPFNPLPPHLATRSPSSRSLPIPHRLSVDSDKARKHAASHLRHLSATSRSHSVGDAARAALNDEDEDAAAAQLRAEAQRAAALEREAAGEEEDGDESVPAPEDRAHSPAAIDEPDFQTPLEEKRMEDVMNEALDKEQSN